MDGGEAALPADAVVRLWHPVTANAGEVRAWRQFLLDRLVAQPVKQAFREVYVRTPTEEETRDYSNRFASHVFRQEQARALLKGRGWTAQPRAAWDDGIDHGTALREHERTGIRAEFYFDPADSPPTRRSPTSRSSGRSKGPDGHLPLKHRYGAAAYTERFRPPKCATA